MARELKGRIKVVVEMIETITDLGAGSKPVHLDHGFTYEWEFTSGTTDGTMMDRVYSTDASSTTTPQDLDLVGSTAAIIDTGLTVSMADPCVIAVLNDAAAGSGDIQIGAGANPYTGMLAAADVASVKPQGLLLWVAPNGAAATGGASDILRTVASAGTIARRMVVAGRSA